MKPGLVIIKIDDRTLRVGGEAMIEGPVHFVIYGRYLTHWEDGTPFGGRCRPRSWVDVQDRVVIDQAYSAHPPSSLSCRAAVDSLVSSGQVPWVTAA